MVEVVKKFFIASMFMWIAPLAILFGFNHNLLPGSAHLSAYGLTLLSGLLVVLSVNIVIAFYIYLAIKEPSGKHELDPAFLAKAKASISSLLAKWSFLLNPLRKTSSTARAFLISPVEIAKLNHVAGRVSNGTIAFIYLLVYLIFEVQDVRFVSFATLFLIDEICHFVSQE